VHDVIVRDRCPVCLAPLVEYIHHDPPGSPLGPIVNRVECVACPWTSEDVEGATDH
jgi:hypothetical protein